MQNLINKIHHIEALELLKSLPDNSIDLVLTDPPYGVRKKEEWDDKDNFVNNLDLWMSECYRVSGGGCYGFAVAECSLNFSLS